MIGLKTFITDLGKWALIRESDEINVEDVKSPKKEYRNAVKLMPQYHKLVKRAYKIAIRKRPKIKPLILDGSKGAPANKNIVFSAAVMYEKDVDSFLKTLCELGRKSKKDLQSCIGKYGAVLFGIDDEDTRIVKAVLGADEKAKDKYYENVSIIGIMANIEYSKHVRPIDQVTYKQATGDDPSSARILDWFKDFGNKFGVLGNIKNRSSRSEEYQYKKRKTKSSSSSSDNNTPDGDSSSSSTGSTNTSSSSGTQPKDKPKETPSSNTEENPVDSPKPEEKSEPKPTGENPENKPSNKPGKIKVKRTKPQRKITIRKSKPKDQPDKNK